MAVNVPPGENPGTASVLDTAAFAGSNIFLTELRCLSGPQRRARDRGTFIIVSRSLRSGLAMSDSQGGAPKADEGPCEPSAPGGGAPPQPTLGAPKRISRGPADSLTRRWKGLLQLKDQLSSPISKLIALVSAACGLYKFIVGMGNLSFPVLGFAAVSLFALLVPGGAPRLFAMRAFAFAIDVLSLGVLTIAFLPFLYEGDTSGPSEFAITCVVWLWFAYFLLLDWRLHGTPGKRMLGLRLLAVGAKFGFFRQLLRTLLTLLLPVVAGIWAGRLFLGFSRFGFAALLFIKAAFLLANPVSILVLGGNQGFADRATHTEVRAGYRTLRSGRRGVNARSWIFACTLPSAAALAIGVFGYIFGGNLFPMGAPFRIPAKQTGESVTAYLSWADPGDVLKSACLTPGFRDLSEEVQSLQINTLSRNPFTTENTDLFVNPIDAANLGKTDGLPVVRIKTTSWVSPASYSMIARNLARCYGMALDEGKHSTAVVQFEQLDDYGFFVVVRSQFTILGVDRNGSRGSWGMADLRPKAAAELDVSSDLGGYALLGDWDIRDRIVNVY